MEKLADEIAAKLKKLRVSAYFFTDLLTGLGVYRRSVSDNGEVGDDPKGGTNTIGVRAEVNELSNGKWFECMDCRLIFSSRDNGEAWCSQARLWQESEHLPLAKAS